MKLTGSLRFCCAANVSVLNREPMGMKPIPDALRYYATHGFSAQPRADGDEARWEPFDVDDATQGFSAQPRADGDEAILRCGGYDTRRAFQCSTASRWG